MYSFSDPLIEYKILKKNCRETKGLILGFILLRGLNWRSYLIDKMGCSACAKKRWFKWLLEREKRIGDIAC